MTFAEQYMPQMVAADEAIKAGKTLGQFLRDLPGMLQMSIEELQQYAKAYVELRSGK